jgi:hypothetical protein
MARKQGWALFFLFLLGILGASIFWLYGPYLKGEVARQVDEAVKTRQLALEVSKGGGVGLKGPGFSALGWRYQLLTDGRNTFLADLKEGRVWRYYHHTREGGYGREDEGFLPLSVYSEGKKYSGAGEMEPPQVKSGEPAPARP